MEKRTVWIGRWSKLQENHFKY